MSNQYKWMASKLIIKIFRIELNEKKYADMY